MTNKPPITDMICLGEITAPHGVRGAVRVRTFTEEPASLTAYGPLTDQSGTKTFEVKQIGRLKEAIICQIKGIETRNDAETMRGIKLYIRADQLPQLDDEIYHSDLIGYAIKTIDGKAVGTVQGIENYGSSDLIDVLTTAGKSLFIPYIDTVVKQIDRAGKIFIIDPIPGLLEPIKGETDVE